MNSSAPLLASYLNLVAIKESLREAKAEAPLGGNGVLALHNLAEKARR